MQKIVIFDMDGTLIDSKKDITLSINAIRKAHYDLEPLSDSFVVDAINADVRNLPKLFYGTDSYEKKDQHAFEEHYTKQCVQNASLYEGIKEMLQRLQAEGVKLGVATNAPTKFAKLMLESLDILDIFGLVVGADAVENSKPSPDMLLKILEFYSYDAKRDSAWMVGDNSKDMQSATNAGIDGLFALWGFTPQSEYKTTLSHPKEVISIVL
jgi:phosphoglycolate phosphatase